MVEGTVTKKSEAQQVNELRQQTGAGMMDCKKALKEAGWDAEKAKKLIRQRGIDIVKKKSGRSAKEGLIFSYVHQGGKIAVLVEINCETDFVARNDEFQKFGRDVSMQIAASHPLFVSKEDVDPAWVEGEKEVFKGQVKDKPENIQDKIISGKLSKRFEEVCLLDQKFIKDEDKQIQDLVNDLISKLGERIVIKRFQRFELGSD